MINSICKKLQSKSKQLKFHLEMLGLGETFSTPSPIFSILSIYRVLCL